MKLKEVKIRNFLGYKDSGFKVSQSDGENNVIVFKGKNGRGKTSTTLALVWAFQGIDGLQQFLVGKSGEIGKGSKSTDLRELFVELNKLGWTNDDVWDSDNVEDLHGGVDIWFEHENENYLLQRHWKHKENIPKNKHKSSLIETFTIEVNGNPVKPSAETWISMNFPKWATQFFIVDGEDMQKYERTARSKDVKNALHKVIGLPYIQETIDLLNGLNKQYLKGIKEDLGQEGQDLIDGRGEAEDKLEKLREEKKRIEEVDIPELEDGKKEIDGIVDDVQASKAKADEIRGLEEDVRDREQAISGELKLMDDYVSSGQLAYSLLQEPLKDARDFAANAALTGLKKEENIMKNKILNLELLIDEIIHKDEGECSCGERHKKSDHENLKSRLNKFNKDLKNLRREIDDEDDQTPSEGELSKAYSFTTAFDEMRNKIEGGYDDIDDHNDVILEIKNNIRTIKENAGETLGMEEEWKEWVDKSAAIQSSIEIKTLRLQDLDIEIKDADTALEDINEQFRIWMEKNEGKENVQKKYNESFEFEKMFREIFNEAVKVKIKRISDNMNGIFGLLRDSALATRLHTCGITDQYDIFVKKKNGELITGYFKRSQGYNELIALSFMYGLYKSTELKIPFIIDYPAGRLDDNNTKRLFQNFHKMNEQVLVFVTDKEYTGKDQDINGLLQVFEIDWDDKTGTIIEE